MSADFVELSKAMTGTERASLAALMMGSISKNLVSKTWLKGLSDALEAFNDPDRYGARWIQSLFGTIVPTGIAQIARTQDPYLREALPRDFADEMVSPRCEIRGPGKARGEDIEPRT